eukprot:c2374_g1_i1.p1 GENE.c2374_g1_i1~~c2374_g1_i1.p1  ORF type:complete len:185 (-),score=39.51 c2374_g1_i1:39-560(-)
MANASEKKRLQENEKILQTLKQLIAGFGLYYIIVRIILQYSSFGIWSFLGFLLITAVNVFVFVSMTSAAKPSYDPSTGELENGGQDLHKGLYEYYWDLLYITWFIQVTTTYSNYFWLFFLLIPGYGLWRLWWDLVKPWIFNEGMFAKPEEVESSSSRKKRDLSDRRGFRQVRK